MVAPSELHEMNNLKTKLQLQAVKKYGIDITPVGGRACWADCYTQFDDKLMIWFDTPDHSTHAMTMEINN